jgi:L-ribulose-5-phosphate 4-epimerase
MERPPAEQALREQLVQLHRALPALGLVVWTSGNLSARLPSAEFLIKPSGLHFDQLGPETMVRCAADGRPLETHLQPSSDTATHAYIYRALPEVGAIVHTHSPYATAWAAVGRPIPCVLTAMADEFGGEIPVAGFAVIGGEEIGEEVVRTLSGHRSPAVLLQNHGVFALGKAPEAALKAAVMCEDVAKTVWLAQQLGQPRPIAQADIDRLYARYQGVYGQRRP